MWRQSPELTAQIALIGMRYRIRGALLAGTSLLTITGYAIFVASRDGNARYAAWFVILRARARLTFSAS